MHLVFREPLRRLPDNNIHFSPEGISLTISRKATATGPLENRRQNTEAPSSSDWGWLVVVATDI